MTLSVLFYVFSCVIFFLLGSQIAYLLTKRAIKIKIEEKIAEVDDTNQYSMIWFRGYRFALRWVVNTVIDEEEEEEDDYSV